MCGACVYVLVRICVCGMRESTREKLCYKRETDREIVCVYVCACEKELKKTRETVLL
jgi:hypothetical protein